MNRGTDATPPGAFVDQQGVAHFKIWAPQASSVHIVDPVNHRSLLALRRVAEGYFAESTQSLDAGTLYLIRVDDTGPWPDPCSRFQPQGPHGPSQLVAPDRFEWTDAAWGGVVLKGQVIYEMHVGTFTPEGTFDAAIDRLRALRDLGITMIEVMPIAEFPGRWNWGYDGVQLYAPFHGYGDHEAAKRFVDAAHALGLAVILDVVYNHLGPDGNYLRCFSEHYFNVRHATEWGEALNFDGEHANGMRDLVIENAAYWAREFHVDGFRMDATQAIADDSKEHIIAALIRRVRSAAAPRNVVFIEENEAQHGHHLLPPEAGGHGCDALWNDDFHHAAHVALTGSRDAYYSDFTGRAQELLSAVRHGFLYQGQYFPWLRRRRGSPLRHAAAGACVHYLQNHDQVGNTFGGARLNTLAQPGSYRAMTAVLLLGPQTPLLFMGQEFGSSRPFHYFVDHDEHLVQAVRDGRRNFLKRFDGYTTPAAQDTIADPGALATFVESRLDWSEVDAHPQAVALHRDLLRLRREDPVIASQDTTQIDGAVLSDRAFVLRWYGEEHGDRLLLVNLGTELILAPGPEPLLAPMFRATWQVAWSSEAPIYGGSGVREPVDAEQRWRVPGSSAILLECVREKTSSGDNS